MGHGQQNTAICRARPPASPAQPRQFPSALTASLPCCRATLVPAILKSVRSLRSALTKVRGGAAGMPVPRGACEGLAVWEDCTPGPQHSTSCVPRQTACHVVVLQAARSAATTRRTDGHHDRGRPVPVPGKRDAALLRCRWRCCAGHQPAVLTPAQGRVHGEAVCGRGSAEGPGGERGRGVQPGCAAFVAPGPGGGRDGGWPQHQCLQRSRLRGAPAERRAATPHRQVTEIQSALPPRPRLPRRAWPTASTRCS